MPRQRDAKRTSVTDEAAGIGATVVTGNVEKGATAATLELQFEVGPGANDVLRRLDVADSPRARIPRQRRGHFVSGSTPIYRGFPEQTATNERKNP